MVSGQGATLGIWTPDLLKTLAAGRQVTIFDNRGIGYSTDADPEEENTILGYADSTVDLIDAWGWNSQTSWDGHLVDSLLLRL